MDLGCMKSMKTSLSIQRLVTLSDLGFKCLYINHSLDVRPNLTGDGMISTHQFSHLDLPSTVTCVKTDRLDRIDVTEYDAIQIDEGQFYEDIDTVRAWVEVNNKPVYITALDGDFNRVPFNNGVLNLIPFSDSMTMHTSVCERCLKVKSKVTPARFTNRLVASDEEILVGGSDVYQVSCRDCYIEIRDGLTTDPSECKDGVCYL